MGIQILGANLQTAAAVDEQHDALRVSNRPMEVLSWSSWAQPSGLLAGIASGGSLASFRYVGSGVVLVRRFVVGWLQQTAFLVAQRLEWALSVGRNWSGADGGGTVFTTSSGRHRQTHSSPVVEARIAATSALTVGTRVLDAHPIGVGAVFANAAGVTLQQTMLLSHDAGDHPMVLGNQEGLVLQNLNAMGATGNGYLYVTIEFAEAATY